MSTQTICSIFASGIALILAGNRLRAMPAVLHYNSVFEPAGYDDAACADGPESTEVNDGH
jgi:hypothetical protein